MAAVVALAQELSPSEWRALASHLNARTFQFDLVGNLPVEVVATIFSYLDTSTPFRLQVVRLPCMRTLYTANLPQAKSQGSSSA
jgi:hypothetical protein